MPTPDAISDVGVAAEKYLNAAHVIRAGMQRNEADAKFVANGNEITYIVDTNVVVFYADASDRQNVMRNVDALMGSRSADDVQRILERLTAEYIFSGKLPGQLRGQVYISPSHFIEMVEQTRRIVAQKRAMLLASEPSPVERGDEYQGILKVLTSQATIKDKLGKLIKLVPMWLNAVDETSFFSDRIRRVMFDAPNVIVPLDNESWGAAACRLRPKDVSDWRRRLEAAGSLRSAIDDDADAMASILNLYKNDARSQQLTRTRMYLFVTSDAAVSRAVSDAMEELEKLGIPYFVRTPQDYLPLINIMSIRDAALPDGTSRSLRIQIEKIYFKIQEALLWLDRADAVRRSPHALVGTRSVLGELNRSWRHVSELLALMGSVYFEQRSGQVFEALRDFLADPNATRAVTGMIEQSVVGVRNRHMEVAIRGALQRLAGTGRDGAPGVRRVHLRLIGVDLERLIGASVSINAFLDEAISSGRLPSGTLAKIATDPDRRDAQLLAACVFTATEQWRTALDFAQDLVEGRRAESSAGIPVREVTYLYALCLRLNLENGWQFRRAQSLLESNLGSYRREAVSRGVDVVLCRLRDEVELATLLVSAAVAHEILAEDGKDAGGAVEIVGKGLSGSVFGRGVMMMKNALEELRGSQPFSFAATPSLDGQVGPEIVKSVEFQALTNLCGAAVFHRMIPGLRTALSDVPFRLADLVELEEGIASHAGKGGKLRHVDHIYAAAYRALVISGGKTVSARARVRELMDDVSNNAVRLPQCDQDEFRFIGAALESECEAGL